MTQSPKFQLFQEEEKIDLNMEKIDRYNESRQSKLLNQFEDDNLILENEQQNDQIS